MRKTDKPDNRMPRLQPSRPATPTTLASTDRVLVVDDVAGNRNIGTVGIPNALLLKPGPLTPDEFERMKGHTTIGDRLCGTLRSLHRVRPIVRSHHERVDGSGYPEELRGDRLPLLAQVIGMVDVFDALTTTRPYRAALPVGAACEDLNREVQRGWRHRDLLDALETL